MASALLIRAAVGCLAAGIAGSAGAAPPPIAWDAPAGCPSQAVVVAQAEAMLAGSARAAAPGTRFEFQVVRAGDGWRLRGLLLGPDGAAERTLTARDCAALAEAAALIAAIAVDPEHVAPGDGPVSKDSPLVVPPPPEAPALAPAATPGARPAEPAASGGRSDALETVREDMSEEPGSASPAEVAAGERARIRVGGEVGLAAGLGLGALPRPAALLRLHAGARGRRFRVGARASAWLPREVDAAGHPELGGRFWLVSGGVYGCGVVRPGRRVEVPLCGALDVGVVGGRGIGALAVSRAAVSPWVGLSAGPGVRVAVHRRLAVQAALEGLAVLARPRFEVSGVGALCCGATFGGQLTAGLAVTLP